MSDYADIKVGETIYVKISDRIEYIGRVEARHGNVVHISSEQHSVNLAIDLDTTPEFHVIPEEPADIWLTAQVNKGTFTIHTSHGSLILTPKQFEALKGLI